MGKFKIEEMVVSNIQGAHDCLSAGIAEKSSHQLLLGHHCQNDLFGMSGLMLFASSVDL